MPFIASLILWAQASWCGTDEYMKKVHPDWELRRLLMEAAAPIIEAQQRTHQPSCTPSRYIIPLVFHVIYSNSSDSISYERILNQVLRLHEDFRRIPETPGFSSNGADTEIEFSLATKDPNGNPTRGVVYWRYDQPPLNWSSRDFCRETQDFSMKQATGWDRTRYLNVWIVPRLCVQPDPSSPCDQCNSVAGYAFYPSAGATQYGTVLGSAFFWGGSTPRAGRTLVHELGHNLNLAHPFQDGCGTSNCSTSGDRVCDTPPTAVQTGNFSVRRQNTCTNDSPDLPDNMRNYMDYVDDDDMTHFTAGQRARAWAAIQNSSWRLAPLVRPTVPQQTGTGPYGLVKAYFAASHTVGCPNEPIQFFSYSMGAPHIFEWNFSGGVPDNPSASCPTVTFSSPGVYDVRLIVENQSGRRDTLLKTGYIRIEDTVYTLPYAESFERTVFPPPHSYIHNPDNSRRWERFHSTSPPRGAYGASQASMRLLFFSYGSYGEKDSWITPRLDLRPYVNTSHSIQLKFSWAYACLNYEGQIGSYTSYNLDYIDSLRVYVSEDCGRTWTLLWERGGRDLATHPAGCIAAQGSISGTAQFLPTANQWATDSILLDAYKGKTIKLRFEGVSGWGNNLFLDDIRVDTIPALQTTLSQPAAHIRAYVSGSTLYLSVPHENLPMSITLYDLLGREVWQAKENLSSGNHAIALPTSFPMGVYLVRLETKGEVMTLRYWHNP
ncbi:MAG: M43 family zinc metalloprotease [Bacteroidia bacterium]|nr:M43 family zinc metalloprotease [Bacteroidia bacterium]MDW8058353.1 M43 family zinc metalloprotease [Bacteroidia bacterium]